MAGGQTYSPEIEEALDAWVQAKRARDFETSDAIQRELEAVGVDTKLARPDPRKAGGQWGAGGGGQWGGGKGGGQWGGAKGGGGGGGGGGGQWGGGGKGGGGNGGRPAYSPEIEEALDAWVQAKRARDFVTSDAIQAELEAQGVDTKTARPDPRKAANQWDGGGGGGGGCGGGCGGCGARPTYDAATEARLDEWVQAKRARDFDTSDAIQRELEAQGVDTKLARPDPRKAGGQWNSSSWDGKGGWANSNSWESGGKGSWGSSSGGKGGDQGQMLDLMSNMMNMMNMMKGKGGKDSGKGKRGPY